MKLNPPSVVVDDSAPFKDALPGRKEFADSLTTLLRNVNENMVVFVHAPWGEGKTTFSRMWRSALRGQKLEVIYFDAYASDYFDDPFVCFSGEILELVETRLAAAKGMAETQREFKKTAVEVGRRLVGLGMKVGLRALTMRTVEAADLGELKDIGTEAATGVSEIGAKIIEKRLEQHASETEALAAFKQSLCKLAAIVREEQGFPLTIVIDELDRCRPDFALGLLERIKHLFDVEGVAFVLLVNQEQIESYVRKVYGEKVDARAYLLKFANLFVDLPATQKAFRRDDGRAEFCRRLFAHYKLPVPGDDFQVLRSSVRFSADHFNLTLREIEKVFSVLALYYGSLPRDQVTEGFLIGLLAVLKVKHPILFRELGRDTVDVSKFFAETKLSALGDLSAYNVNGEWVSNILQYCLISDAELEKHPEKQALRQSGDWLAVSRLSRRKVLPLFCDRLEQFSFSPAKELNRLP